MENENKDVTEETKKENKEEIKEATKEETKEETTKEETKEETNDKTKKSKKGLWIGLGILVVLLIAYGVGAFYYHSHFLYQTSVNDTDCSNLTAAEVAWTASPSSTACRYLEEMRTAYRKRLER